MIKLEFINIIRSSKENITILLTFLIVVIGIFLIILFTTFGEIKIWDVLSSFGIELVAGAILFILLDRKIRNAITSSSAIKEKISLPQDIINKIKNASFDGNITILTTFFSFIKNDNHTDQFKREIINTILNKRTRIRILILEPISHAAEQRFKNMAEALKNSINNSDKQYPSIQDAMLTLKYLNKIAVALEEKENETKQSEQKKERLESKPFEVKIFNQLPPYILYKVDYDIFITWYANQSVSADENFLILKHYSKFSNFITDKFDDIWNDKNSNCSLSEYFYIIINESTKIYFVDIINLETGDFPSPQILAYSISDNINSEIIKYRGKDYEFSAVTPGTNSDMFKLNNFTLKKETDLNSYVRNLWGIKYSIENFGTDTHVKIPDSFSFIELVVPVN